jgi:hypothetical protein
MNTAVMPRTSRDAPLERYIEEKGDVCAICWAKQRAEA